DRSSSECGCSRASARRDGPSYFQSTGRVWSSKRKVSGWHAPSSCSLGSGTRLLYSRHGSGQVEILVQRPFHDPGQLRITKARPPLVKGRWWQRAGTSFDGGRVVKRLQIHCRATIFWPHGTTREDCG